MFLILIAAIMSCGAHSVTPIPSSSPLVPPDPGGPKIFAPQQESPQQ